MATHLTADRGDVEKLIKVILGRERVGGGLYVCVYVCGRECVCNLLRDTYSISSVSVCEVHLISICKGK